MKMKFLPLLLSVFLLLSGCSKGMESVQNQYIVGTLTDFSSTDFTIQMEDGSQRNFTLPADINLEEEQAVVGDEIGLSYNPKEDVIVYIHIYKFVTGTLEKFGMGTFDVRTADGQLYQFKYADGAKIRDAVEGDTIWVKYAIDEFDSCAAAILIEKLES